MAGFRAAIEESIGDGMSVDVVVEDENNRLAIEVSVSTPTRHEIGNIRKCLDAGFHHVVFACPDASKVDLMAKLIAREYPEEKTVHCILLGQVGDLLRVVKASAKPKSDGETGGGDAKQPPPIPGVKSSRSLKEVDPKLAAEKKMAAFEKIKKAMKKLKRPEDDQTRDGRAQ